VFAEVGYDALTVEAVAARAGVGKATVYRRFAGKTELVVAAVTSFTELDEPPPDTGSTAGDLTALLERLVGILTATPLGDALPALLATRARVPEIDAAFERILAAKRRRNSAVVLRGIERGDIAEGTDPMRVIDASIGAVFYRFLVSGRALDRAFVAGAVAATLRAFAPPCAEPATGAAAPRSGTRGRATGGR